MLHRGGSGVPLAFGLALALVLVTGGTVVGARAQEEVEDNQLASITIYTAVCPPGYDGDDLFADCYDNPGTDIDYLLTGPTFPETVTNTTDAAGFTAFEGIDEAGVYDLQIDVPGDFADFVIFCSDEFGDPFTSADSTEVGAVELDLTLDDDVRCDFYVIPEDLRGETPAPTPTRAAQATATTVTLPSTGAGSGSEGGTGRTLAWALILLAAGGAAVAGRHVASAASRPRR